MKLTRARKIRSACTTAIAGMLFLAISANAASSREIALTFDDLPMTVVGNDHIAGPIKESRQIDENLIRQLAAHHATAIGFVNEVKLNVEGERDARAQLLEEWLNAGLLLGNHGYSHQEFNTAGLQLYEDEFIRGDVVTPRLLQAHHLNQRYFRHPYLDTGGSPANKSGFEQFLSAHKYLIAPVTIQNEDWMFNAPYAAARARGDNIQVEKVRAAYLAHTAEAFDYAEKLSRDSFHRNIPQVMLMHADLLNSENLDAVLTLMEKRGYRFISLDEALADPAYKTPDNYTGPDGISWLDRWQIALGHPIHPNEPEPPKWVQQQYDSITGTKE